MASKSKRSATKQAQRVKKPRGKPFTRGNTVGAATQFKPGKSGNPGGRPKGLSDAYKEWLAAVNANDPLGRTNAQLGAMAIGLEMLKGDTAAAREIRSATEGDTLNLEGAVMVQIDK